LGGSSTEAKIKAIYWLNWQRYLIGFNYILFHCAILNKFKGFYPKLLIAVKTLQVPNKQCFIVIC